jgi:regulator of protease activity HflC (stomatin/prohibitin superfamily)
MLWLILGIILLVIGAVLLVARNRFVIDDSRAHGYPDGAATRRLTNSFTVVGIFLLILGAFTVVMDSFTVVPARNVGVVNTFGKAEAALDNGFHWVKPWSSIETVDATVQNINRDADTKNCVTVRLANQTTACVDVTVQWNIDQNANANELWQRYRGSNDDVVGNVSRNVVERELQRALNRTYESYNPLAILQSGQAPTKTDDLAAAALKDMRIHVDKGIVVDTLLIAVTHFDDTTQGKLNAFAQALADTQVATQTKLTNEQIKAANDLLASASSNDPGVKYQNCLTLIKDLASKGQLQNLPPTFNCGDSSTPVIVGQK